MPGANLARQCHGNAGQRYPSTHACQLDQGLGQGVRIMHALARSLICLASWWYDIMVQLRPCSAAVLPKVARVRVHPVLSSYHHHNIKSVPHSWILPKNSCDIKAMHTHSGVIPQWSLMVAFWKCRRVQRASGRPGAGCVAASSTKRMRYY